MKKIKVLFGCAALGLATTILLQLMLLGWSEGTRIFDIIFEYSPAIPIIVFGALWYPLVKKKLRTDELKQEE